MGVGFRGPVIFTSLNALPHLAKMRASCKDPQKHEPDCKKNPETRAGFQIVFMSRQLSNTTSCKAERLESQWAASSQETLRRLLLDFHCCWAENLTLDSDFQEPRPKPGVI